MSVLKDLYASEINARIATFYDAGFSASLGDPINGVVAEATFETYEEAENFLHALAILHFPGSEYALGAVK